MYELGFSKPEMFSEYAITHSCMARRLQPLDAAFWRLSKPPFAYTKAQTIVLLESLQLAYYFRLLSRPARSK